MKNLFKYDFNEKNCFHKKCELSTEKSLAEF